MQNSNTELFQIKDTDFSYINAQSSKQGFGSGYQISLDPESGSGPQENIFLIENYDGNFLRWVWKRIRYRKNLGSRSESSFF